ncbi:MAG: chromosomal replication initiation protein DnaA [Bacteroidetes bacterium GWF2_43_63]|nr:MAG: chromosomal replication initiation protein DnaA [Bacteroidetes bacterium GWE2_42_42]OFY56081.1 MAG: chromosomal replication initiation protein DnaA [Bacteroidetes bacterium GWF2_43_63]HBG70665.1 chromosomal replication initiator protein DnaA [Bacteroidales bacterium]HCB62507.1 chromosomal replication initiator protein DnaA [Bacteroidales bacterium]HCY21962.1 chromosomal replication initiator protein DnaA [Bacteroidales bacterium]
MAKDIKSIWNNCLKVIKDNIDDHSFSTWFAPIKPLKLDGNVLTIQVPSSFFYEWIEEHYIDLLKKIIRKELGQDGKLEYNILVDATQNGISVNYPSSDRSALKNPSVDIPIDINRGTSKEIPNPFIIPGLRKIKVNSQLVESLNFDNFVEGDCNRLARSAGLAIAKNPGKTSFNPLFIFSDTGLGKTHLAHAIGIEVKKNFPDKTVLYVQTSEFLNQFIDSVKDDTTNDFVHFYQMIDVLIMDDIHNLANKLKTQDVFFQLFNTLHQKGNQIILTSDKPPVELEDIEPRLLSRFKWGLAADLQVPDIETRIAIIRKKLHKDGITIPDDVVEYLAYSISTNIRELEGAMISLIAHSSFNRKPITIELAKTMIDQYVRNSKREISIDYIQKMVCDYFNISVEQMHSSSRKREIVQARQLAMYFAKTLTKSSLASIGTDIGGKDHATVLHAVRTVKNLIDTDKHFRVYVEEIEKKIKL